MVAVNPIFLYSCISAVLGCSGRIPERIEQGDITISIHWAIKQSYKCAETYRMQVALLRLDLDQNVLGLKCHHSLLCADLVGGIRSNWFWPSLEFLLCLLQHVLCTSLSRKLV